MKKSNKHGYTIYENGVVLNKRGVALVPYIDTNGYLQITLYNDTIPTKYRIHRLVAEAFLANPDDKPVVNHIDGNKTNNNVNNLEWATYSENNQHAYDTNLQPIGRVSKLSLEEIHDIMTCTDTAENMATKYPQVTSGHIRNMRNGRFIQEYKRSHLYNEEVLLVNYKDGNKERRNKA